MDHLDAAWVAFGVFMLACGAAPALLAWAAEHRRPPARQAGKRAAVVFHEPVHAAGPEGLAQRDAALAAAWRRFAGLPARAQAPGGLA